MFCRAVVRKAVSVYPLSLFFDSRFSKLQESRFLQFSFVYKNMSLIKSTAKPPAKSWSSLTGAGDFQRVYKKGVRFFTKNLGLFALVGDDIATPRLGFVASAAKAGNAVQRNRAKRRMRALARTMIVGKVRPNGHYVLIATSDTGTADPAMLQKDLQQALQRLKLLAD